MNIQSNDLNKVWEELNNSSHYLPPPSSVPELLGPFFVIQEEQRATTANFTSSEELDINVNNLIDSIKQKLDELNRCISSDEHIYCPDDYSFVQNKTEIITSLMDEILTQMNLQG